MLQPSRIPQIVLLATLAAGSAAAQGSNDVPLNNGEEVFNTFSSPSVGGQLKSPPTGDMFWKVLPGDRVLDHRTAGGAVVEIDGYVESLFDTDWSTPPPFYSRAHGHAVPNAQGVLEPEFFTAGPSSEAYVLMGSSGFGNPCTIVPSLCSPSGGSCPPPGTTIGYLVELTLSAGIQVPADGTSASDLATTYFVPGGMTTTGGTCGLGDYALQDSHSTDETMVGVSGNRNPYGGYTLNGVPFADGKHETTTAEITFANPMLNVRADSGTGLGEETSPNGGGGMNALRLSVGGGLSAVNVEVRSNQDTGPSSLAFVGASQTVLPGTSIPVLGADILILPTPLTTATAGHWQGPVVPTVFPYQQDGAFVGTPLAVPAQLAGTDVYFQGLIFDLTSLTADNTNAWRTSMLP